MRPADREALCKQGEELCDQAIHSANQGEFETALELFEKAENLFSQIQDLHWLTFLRHEKLHSLIGLERVDEALELADKTVYGYLSTYNSRGLVPLLILKATILIERKELNRALETIKTAENIATQRGYAELTNHILSTLADCLMEQENFLEAIQALRELTPSEERKDQSEEYGWALLRLGVCFQAICHPDKAEGYFKSSSRVFQEADTPRLSLQSLSRLKRLYENAGREEKIRQVERQMEHLEHLR